MARKLSSIELWNVNRSAQIGVTYPIRPAVHTVITRRLGEPDELTLRFVAAGHPDAPKFTRRRVVKTIYDDGTEELWRVLRTNEDYAGGEPVTVECLPLWMDLEDSAAEIALTSGTRVARVILAGVEASVALARILSAEYGCPSLFVPGTIDASLASRQIFIQAAGASHAELLRMLAEQLDGAEWRARWTGTVYAIDVAPQFGSTDAASRPIRAAGIGEKNRFELTRASDASDYFSAVYPVGTASDGSVFTIARAFWAVQSASYNAAQNRTTIVLNGDPVYQTGALDGHAFRTSGGASYSVVSSTAPGTIVVSGNAAAVTRGRFTKSDGSDLTTLTDPLAEALLGRRVRTEMFSGSPAGNMLEEGGVSADLSDWIGGLPVGWSGSAGVVFTQESDERYVVNGTSSARITFASKGAYAETIDVPFTPTEVDKVVSAWMSGKLIGGEVRLEIIDGAGTVYPAGSKAVAASREFAGLEVSGEVPTAGTLRLRITAETDGAELILDAVTLVQASKFQEYAPDMGPRALWKEAARLLTLEGGIQPDAFEGEFYDLGELMGGAGDNPSPYEPVRIGDYVRIEDEGLEPFDARVVELVEEYEPDGMPLRKGATISRKRAEFKRRFDHLPPAGALPAQAGGPVPEARLEENIYQEGTTGYVELTPVDPGGILQRVVWASAAGGNIPEGATYSPASLVGGKYVLSAPIVEGHGTTIAWRGECDAPFPDITGAHTFDKDRIPRGSYDVTYDYDSGLAGILVTVACRGDEDTASFKITFTRGSDVQVTTTNGRAVSVACNTLYPLAPGEAFELEITAYAGPNATGTPEAAPYEASLAAPASNDPVSGDFVPQSRTITVTSASDQISVSGGTQDLSQNRTWTVNGLSTTSAPTFAGLTITGTSTFYNNLLIDSENLGFKAPNTIGGWSRGIDLYRADGTRYGKIGTYGAGATVSYIYIAHGEPPHTSGLGIYLRPDGKTGIGTTAPDYRLDVSGDARFADTVYAGGDILPVTGYKGQIGNLDRKFLALHVGEIWAETLVTAKRRVTTGGRLTVGVSGNLYTDHAIGDTFIRVKGAPGWNTNDILHLENNGRVEFMRITSVGGTYNPGTEDEYTIYHVARNLDGTGANTWYAGDAILNTGQAGNGFLDLTAQYSFTDTSQSGGTNIAGPTVTAWQRTGLTWNQVEPRAVFGNLRNKFGYGASDVFGFAAGTPAGPNVTIDPTNGIRFRSGNTTLAQIQSGSFNFGDKLTWNGTTLAVTGTLTASAGSNIAGWVTDATAIYKLNNVSTSSGYAIRILTEFNGVSRPLIHVGWGGPDSNGNPTGPTQGPNYITIGAQSFLVSGGIGQFSAGWDTTGGGIAVNAGGRAIFFAGLRNGIAGGAIAGWNFDHTSIFGDVNQVTSISTAGVYLYISNTTDGGSNYFYAGRRLQGFGMAWHRSANAGHLILGQMAATVNTVRTGYYGLQMMDHTGREYFGLGGRADTNSAQVYAKIAGTSFDWEAIWSGTKGAAAWQLNASGSIQVAAGNVTLDANGILIASGTNTWNRIRWGDGTYIHAGGFNAAGTLRLNSNGGFPIIVQAIGGGEIEMSATAGVFITSVGPTGIIDLNGPVRMRNGRLAFVNESSHPARPASGVLLYAYNNKLWYADPDTGPVEIHG